MDVLRELFLQVLPEIILSFIAIESEDAVLPTSSAGTTDAIVVDSPRHASDADKEYNHGDTGQDNRRRHDTNLDNKDHCDLGASCTTRLWRDRSVVLSRPRSCIYVFTTRDRRRQLPVCMPCLYVYKKKKNCV
jgi:hypothetical protein